jgi:hypothetical protein
MGSPAVDRYKAALMYISPAWLRANAAVLTETAPSGTGEHDFALLAVTASASTSTRLPLSFPSVPLATEPPRVDAPVAIASYGAQYLELDQILSALFPTVVFDSVREVFTFATHTIDVFALSGSSAAQEGSSGGGVLNSKGELVGMLTTSSMNGKADDNSLHSITASYIRTDYANDTGQSLDSLLSQSPTAVATSFAPKIPALESILTAHLP